MARRPPRTSSPAQGTANLNEVNAEWFIAQHQGQRRDIAWYFQRAQAGDVDAAKRCIELALSALGPRAVGQNSGVDSTAVEVLQATLQPVLTDGDAPLLRLIREGAANRPKDNAKSLRHFWTCVEMQRRIAAASRAGTKLSQTAAAEAVLGAAGGYVGVSTLVRVFSGHQAAVISYLKEVGEK